MNPRLFRYWADARRPALRRSRFTLEVSENVASYPDLRRALSRHLRDVGDQVEMGQPDAARDALRAAIAISSEVRSAQAKAT